MTLRSYLKVAIVICCTTAPSLAGQQQSMRNGPVTPFGLALSSRGITTRQGTLAALNSGDLFVRALAAYKLAQDRDPDGLAAVRRASQAETDTPTKIEFATALWSMGDAAGFSQLEAMCVDDALSSDDAISAAKHLAYGRKGGVCAGRLLAMLAVPDSSMERQKILPILGAILPTASAGAIEEITKAATAAASDGSLSVRLEAGGLLSQIGSPESLDALRSALRTERNETVRSGLSAMLSGRDEQGSQPAPAGGVRSINPRLSADQSCSPQSCPNSVAIATRLVLPLAPEVPIWLTGVGIATGMQVGYNNASTNTNYNGVQIVEQVAQVQNSCPGHSFSDSACSAAGTFTVGTGGVLVDGELVPPLPDVFYDQHTTVYNNSVLQAAGLASCTVVCSQIYTCNGSPIGSFTITRIFTRGTSGKYAVTNVSVTKQ